MNGNIENFAFDFRFIILGRRWKHSYYKRIFFFQRLNGEVLKKNILVLQVSDVNDDVRRAAVTSIGFILFR